MIEGRKIFITGGTGFIASTLIGRLIDRNLVVCFSTSEVFGSHAWRVTEKHNTTVGAVGEPRWTYAVSKLAEEHLAKAYHIEQGLPTVIVRPFNIYGPGQVGEGAIRTFITH